MQLTSRGHTVQAVRALVDIGWRIDSAPPDGILSRNGQQLRLRWGRRELAFRLFIYKITGSGRNEHERRVEITTTYQKGLEALLGYEDIVLGYDPALAVFVGVDARRIEHGGATGNASSFIDPAGINNAKATEIIILRRQSQLFGIERHAYFKPPRLAEYLVNAIEIHRGEYDGAGDFSKSKPLSPRPAFTAPATGGGTPDVVMHGPANLRKPQTVRMKALEAYEEGDAPKLKRMHVTQSELSQLAARLREIGLKGEEHVFKAEVSRLRRNGRADLASKVTWVSQSRPYEGYDILSFETDGEKRFIEVKSTPGTKKSFPMSDNEWRVAEQMGNAYFIYRVTTIFSSVSITVLRNPVALEIAGKLSRGPLVWMVTYI